MEAPSPAAARVRGSQAEEPAHTVRRGRSGLYYNNDLAPGGKHLFHEDEVSDEARREEEGRTLWDLSAKLVGLPA